MAEYICREAIIDNLEKEIEAGNVALDEDVWINKGLRIAIRDIKDIKTADVQRVKQWVKLHDKHPDTEGLYLVCNQYGECEVVEYLPDIKSWFTHKIKGEIQYWMPLPEPPKDGDTNG